MLRRAERVHPGDSAAYAAAADRGEKSGLIEALKTQGLGAKPTPAGWGVAGLHPLVLQALMPPQWMADEQCGEAVGSQGTLADQRRRRFVEVILFEWSAC